jgi:LAS superfamily LD-carboxypeptidase LdcB
VATKRKSDRKGHQRKKLPDLYTTLGCPPQSRLHLKRQAFGTHIAILQERALRSLENVWDEVHKHGGVFYIASTYRSCATQREVCSNIPNCGPNGCPGRCAPPGHSYHQLGLAVDAPGTKETATVRRVFYKHGWHNFSSHDSLRATGSDPWHFSFHVTG